MNSRFISILLLMAMLVVNNVHLVALQVPAWGGMLLKYSRSGTVIEAVEKTFDGEHPCRLCKAITKARAASAGETKLQGVRTDRLADIQAEPPRTVAIPLRPFASWPVRLVQVRSPRPLKSPPPTPPPITA